MSSKNKDTRTQILEATWQLLEKGHGQGVRMSDIAKAVGISRQAVYLHFSNRTELMIATTHYVDEVKGLQERLSQLQTATNGIDLLNKCVDVWGNYIPEIFGIAKALLTTRETDEAADAAWNDVMGCLKDACQEIVNYLEEENTLAAGWSKNDAVEMLWTQLSIQNWEILIRDSDWTTDQYIAAMKRLLIRTFIK